MRLPACLEATPGTLQRLRVENCLSRIPDCICQLAGGRSGLLALCMLGCGSHGAAALRAQSSTHPANVCMLQPSGHSSRSFHNGAHYNGATCPSSVNMCWLVGHSL